MPTKYEKACPRCGRSWSTSFNTCQKCPGVALEVRDMADNPLVDTVRDPNQVYHGDPNCPGPMCPYCTP